MACRFVRPRRWLPLLAGLVSANATAQGPAPAFDAQLAAILPTASERQWLDVPWRPDLRDGLLEAQRLDRPIVLWAMNGHPLGQC